MSAMDQYHLSPREYSALVEKEETWTARLLLLGILGLLIAFIIWASFSRMETMTRGSGKVIPSSKVKVVQHFEGGIVYSILAEEGELVETGQPIVVIDNTKAESELESVQTRLLYALGKIGRLEALANLDENSAPAPVFASEVEEQLPDIIFQEKVAYDSARAEYNANITEFDKREERMRQEKNSIRKELALHREKMNILSGTIRAYENLRGARDVSRLEMDEKRNQLIDTQLTIASLEANLPMLESELTEVRAQRQKYSESFRYDVVQQLTETKAEAQSSRAVLRDRQEALTRTQVLSPIDGIVNQLYVTAPGEVIKPGGDVAEIVPVEDKLIAEILIPPSEIGFIKLGQPVRIKVSAFDAVRYGSLNGQVIGISSDTITDEDAGKQAGTSEFYRVRAASDELLFDREGNELKISSGMTVTVDIVTGNKRVAEYILLPIMRSLDGSLRHQ